MYKILIVEDDNTIAERLASHLTACNPGYWASVLQWILLVPGDPKAVQCADPLSVIDE